MSSEFGYWNTRALGESIRLLLKYVGEDFKDVRYVCGDAPDFDRSEWLNVKFTLGLEFPNLPYYIDGDIKLTQSNAILQHLARKYNLYGNTEKEKAHSDMLLNVIMDLHYVMFRVSYNAENCTEEVKNKYLEDSKKDFAALETYLGDKKFFLGDQLTVSDFHIFDVLDQHQKLQQGFLSTLPKLEAFTERFREVPAIKAYVNSDVFKATPHNNKMAKF